MALGWNPVAVPAIVSFGLGLAAAAFVLWARPDRPQNRWLAFSLVVGSTIVGGAVAIQTLGGVLLSLSIAIPVTLLIPIAYLGFLATLDTPLVRPFQTRAARITLSIYTLVVEALWFYDTDLFAPVNYVNGTYRNIGVGPLGLLNFVPPLVLLVYGLVVALSAYRNARTPILRQRAKAYAIAFGLRDGLFLILILFTALAYNVFPAWANGSLGPHFGSISIPLIDVLFIALLGYGILRSQLFGIDLKIKWTARRGAVLGALAGVFFLVKEAVEQLLPVEGVVPGVLAAAAIAAVTLPAWRITGNLVDHLMPGVRASPEYLDSRKADVYQGALEELLSDGEISPKERAALERMRASLGIARADAASMEGDVAAALATKSARR